MKKNTVWNKLAVAMLIGSMVIPSQIQAKSLPVRLNKKTASIIVGKTVRLKVKNTKKKVAWSSKNRKIATVNTKGVVKGKKPGKSVIVAKVGKKALACRVTVKKKAAPMPKPTSRPLITPGPTQEPIIRPSATPERAEDGHVHKVKWSVIKEPSKEAATSLDDFGLRTGICEGCGKVYQQEEMINVGGGEIICGYFDSENEEEVLYWVDRQRRCGSTTGMQDFDGKPIAVVTANKLTVTKTCQTIARIRAAQAAWHAWSNKTNEGVHNEKMTANENFASGCSNGEAAYEAWCYSASHVRTMISDYKDTGVGWFWADCNDEGECYPFCMQVFDGIYDYWTNLENKEEIKNNITGIPDSNFYKAAVEKCDINKDGVLTQGEASVHANLDFSNLGIENIQGIQYFTGTPDILLAGNKITDLTPLKEMAKEYYFDEIDLSHNPITDITCLDGLDTTSLNLSHTLIKDIRILPQIKIPQYGNLDLSHTQVQDISWIAKAKVGSVLLAGLGLTSVEGLAGRNYYKLDISDNQIHNLSPLNGCEINKLNWSNNGLSTKEFETISNVEKLSSITVSNNGISDLSVLKKYKDMDDIVADHNQIQTVKEMLIVNDRGGSIDLSYNQIAIIEKSMKGFEINLSYNQMKTTKNIEGTEAIYPMGKLNLSHNKIVDLDGIGNLLTCKFEELNLSYNSIADVSILKGVTIGTNSNTKRYYWDFTYNRIEDISSWKDSELLKQLADVGYSLTESFHIGPGNKITAKQAWEIFPESMLFAQKQASHNYGNTTTNYFWYEMEGFVTSEEAVPADYTGLRAKKGPGGTTVLAYYTNGKIDYSHHGLEQYEDKLYLVWWGTPQLNTTGIIPLKEDGYQYYYKYYKDIDFDKVANICKVKNGVIDTEFTGFAYISEEYYQEVGDPIYLEHGQWKK